MKLQSSSVSRSLYRRLALLLMGWILPAALLHAENPQPTLDLTISKVIPAQGPGEQEHLAPFTKPRPGDTLEYQVIYANHTQATIRNAQVTLPVPAGGVEYVREASDTQAPELASRDGREFLPLPLTRPHQLPDGRIEQRPAPAADYKYLRWNFGDLPPGGSRKVRARMQMVETASPS
jgi:uncharacterized repeat protein (TIGR01451 family)